MRITKRSYTEAELRGVTRTVLIKGVGTAKMKEDLKNYIEKRASIMIFNSFNCVFPSMPTRSSESSAPSVAGETEAAQQNEIEVVLHDIRESLEICRLLKSHKSFTHLSFEFARDKYLNPDWLSNDFLVKSSLLTRSR